MDSSSKKSDDRKIPSTPRVYINVAEMLKAGMSKEEISEKVIEIFREKGLLKD